MNDNYISRGYLRKPLENDEDGSFQCPRSGCNKLEVYDWLESIPDNVSEHHPVEVRFKNTRKGYFVNTNGIPLKRGDIVAVEGSPGHDIGVVSLTGSLVPVQMKLHNVTANPKKIYRKAKQNDVEKWFRSIEEEPNTMRAARRIISERKLPMKISDVEYQGDKTKVTFYYISDERIDFRFLIKEFADQFRARIEMKQIGSRQEAGRVGGIGTCGRELCCASWMSSFASVTTGAARRQDMPVNLQKLGGQCGKLKCCLNYELKCYMEAQSDFPDVFVPLDTERGRVYHTKTDVFRRIAWYSFGKNDENAALIPLDVDTVKEYIDLNRQGIKVKDLGAGTADSRVKETPVSYQNAAGEDSISRYEEKKRKKNKKRKPNRENGEVKNTEKRENRPAQKEPQSPAAGDETGRHRRGNRSNRSRSRNKSTGDKAAANNTPPQQQ